MLQPKRTKFRKQHKGRIHGEAKGGFALNFGSYALKATEPLPLPIRTSVGFDETGTSGKIRIQTRP